jgi:hypothetical protein
MNFKTIFSILGMCLSAEIDAAPIQYEFYGTIISRLDSPSLGYNNPILNGDQIKGRFTIDDSNPFAVRPYETVYNEAGQRLSLEIFRGGTSQYTFLQNTVQYSNGNFAPESNGSARNGDPIGRADRVSASWGGYLGPSPEYFWTKTLTESPYIANVVATTFDFSLFEKASGGCDILTASCFFDDPQFDFFNAQSIGVDWAYLFSNGAFPSLNLTFFFDENNTDDGADDTLEYSTNQIRLDRLINVTSAPEPNSLMLTGLGALFICFVSKKKKM